jgi:hypothetical protein
MNMPIKSLAPGVAITVLLCACASSAPKKVGPDQWQLVADNYVEGAKTANAHCKSMGLNSLKVIKRQAYEDTVEIGYLCLKE